MVVLRVGTRSTRERELAVDTTEVRIFRAWAWLPGRDEYFSGISEMALLADARTYAILVYGRGE